METEADGYSLAEEITSQTRASKPVGIVVSTRLEREIAERLLEASEASGKKLSQLLREAVLAYLEQGPDQSQEPLRTGAYIGMGTAEGQLNATFTIGNAVVTRSALADHTERVVEVASPCSSSVGEAPEYAADSQRHGPG